MACGRIVYWAAMLLLVVLAPPAFAEAVAGVNGKVQGIYGNVDGDELKAGGLSLTVPLGSRFGLQLDGAYGDLGEDQLKGVDLHLFTRDPENYLLGILGAHSEMQNVDFNRIGLEGEFYRGPVSIVSFLGYQLGDIKETFFGTLDLRWYPMDDLMLVAGGSLADSNDGRLHLGGEYRVWGGFSAYVDVAAGENHYEHALAGLRYYFGGSKNLLRRHREDDPPNPIVNNLLQGLHSIRKKAKELAGP